MIRAIFLSISLIMLLIGCDDGTSVNYKPQVVYLQTPYLAISNGTEVARVVFAISDIENRQGSVKMSISGGSEEELKSRWFEDTGSLFQIDLEPSKLSDTFTITIQSCVFDDDDTDCTYSDGTTVDFPDLKLYQGGSGVLTGTIKSEKTARYRIALERSGFELFANQDEEITIDLPAVKREILRFQPADIELNDDGDGFFRDIRLDGVDLTDGGSFVLVGHYNEHEYYDEPWVDCSYSGTQNPVLPLISLALLLFFLVLRRKYPTDK